MNIKNSLVFIKTKVQQAPKWAKIAVMAGGGIIIVGSIIAISRKASAYVGSNMTYDDLIQSIASLGIDPDVAKAVMKVESGGRPAVGGRLLIRFEPHVFKARTGQTVLLPGMAAATSSEGRKRHGGQDAEYVALNKAISINKDQAYKSISMGLFQIMGFNHKVSGYNSAEEMFNALSSGVGEQYASFFRFLKGYANGGLVQAMKDKNWTRFGKLYNGVESAGPIYKRAYDSVKSANA